jgi:hypothetical protein
MIKQESLTSFPRDFINSTSSGLKLAMDIDFTLCGGVKPRLKQNYNEFQTSQYTYNSTWVPTEGLQLSVNCEQVNTGTSSQLTTDHWNNKYFTHISH